MRLDLQWWDELLPRWNGTASFLETDWTRADTMRIYTDASATQGLGCFFNGAWFNSRWPSWVGHVNPPIEYLKMTPILLALVIWAERLKGKKLIFTATMRAQPTHGKIWVPQTPASSI